MVCYMNPYAKEVKLVEEICGIIGVVNVPLLSTGTADASQGSCADGTERRSHDNGIGSLIQTDKE